MHAGRLARVTRHCLRLNSEANLPDVGISAVANSVRKIGSRKS